MPLYIQVRRFGYYDNCRAFVEVVWFYGRSSGIFAAPPIGDGFKCARQIVMGELQCVLRLAVCKVEEFGLSCECHQVL